MKKLFQNKFAAFTILVVLTFLLLFFDPFFLDSIAPGSAITALYLVIPFVLWYVYIKPRSITKSELTAEEKEYVNKEKVKSFIRSALQVFGAFVAVVTIIGVKIPYIDPIREALQFLSDKADIGLDSVNTIIGIVMYLIGFFKDGERFENRALVNPRKVDL